MFLDTEIGATGFPRPDTRRTRLAPVIGIGLLLMSPAWVGPTPPPRIGPLAIDDGNACQLTPVFPPPCVIGRTIMSPLHVQRVPIVPAHALSRAGDNIWRTQGIPKYRI